MEELIYDAIRNNPGVNAPALAEVLQKSLRTIQRYLKSLSDAERVEFRGAPKNGGYQQNVMPDFIKRMKRDIKSHFKNRKRLAA